MVTLTNTTPNIHFDGDDSYVLLATDNIVDGVPTVQNLLCLLSIVDYGINISPETVGDTLISLHAPYDYDTKTTGFNIKDVFGLKPTLPHPLTLTTEATPVIWAYCYDMYRHYKLYYADKYGLPSTADAFNIDPQLHTAILGGKSLRYNTTNFFDPILTYLGTSKSKTGIIKRPITKYQPDYIYLHTTAAVTIQMHIIFYYQDGTTSHAPIPDTTHTLQSGKTYYFVSGYAQMQLENLSDSTKEVVGYDFIVHNATASYESKSSIIRRFEIVPEYDDTLYFICENGLGGLETFHTQGQIIKTTDTESSIYKKSRWIDSNVEDGEIEKIVASTADKYKVSTDYISPEYANHLKFVLSGKCWQIDMDESKLFNIMINTKSIKIDDTSKDLNAISFSYTNSWTDKTDALI